jgi:hypothetical protein
MNRTLTQFKTHVLAKQEVRIAYDALQDEFAFLDEVLKARTATWLTQAETRSS